MLSDLRNYQTFNEIYSTYFPTYKPVRVTMEAKELPLGVNLEVDAIALSDKSGVIEHI